MLQSGLEFGSSNYGKNKVVSVRGMSGKVHHLEVQEPESDP